MHAYALAAKLRFPNASQVVVIATEPLGGSELTSEDVLYVDVSELNDEQEKLALIARDDLGYLADVRSSRSFDLQIESIQKPFYILDTSRNPKVAKSRRNSSCPCGSGLKFKRCCGSP